MSAIKARPTLYKGIQMRSRLEADYAAHLDREGESWEYEPECFAGPDGQWLPDFRLTGTTVTLVEVKSAHILKRSNGETPQDVTSRIDVTLRQMTTAWQSDPDVRLDLVFWTYRASKPTLVVLGSRSLPWVAYSITSIDCPLLWLGMGQMDNLKGAGVQ